MQRHTRGRAIVWPGSLPKCGAVKSIAAERMPCFGEMNPNLMRPARFQAAFDERVLAQLLDNVHMRDRFLADSRQLRAAAQAITPIAHETRTDRSCCGHSQNDGHITPPDRVRC